MAEETTLIYGKDSCPYTQAAMADFTRKKRAFTYFDVKADAAALARMLGHTKGRRVVPVLVTGEKVEIGYGGT